MGRRVVQYLLDALIVSAGTVVSLALFLGAPTEPDGGVDSSSALFWMILVAVIAWSAFWAVFVWVLRPYGHRGQTFGMQALGIRVVSAAGGEASRGQLLGRMLLLIVDAAAGGLVGLVAMWLSKRDQRVGDMAAGTLVCREATG